MVKVRLLALTLLPVFLRAQPSKPTHLEALSLEELTKVGVATVNGASKFDQKVTTAPSYVTIVTAEEIRQYSYRTLADLLQSIPGFYVNNDRNYSYLGVRGFGRLGDYNDHILLMIDGHRLNDPVYGEALLGTEFPLDMDVVSRVEVIRGPGSALYGADAFFAVINVITKRGRNFRGTEVSAQAGSMGTNSLRATFGKKGAQGPELLLSGTLFRSEGIDRLYFPEFDSPSTNNGVAVNADGDKSGTLFASLQSGGLSLQGLFGSRTKTIPTGSFGTVFNDPRNRATDAQAYFDAKYDRRLTHAWQLSGRAGFDRTDYSGTYIYEDAANRDTSAGDRLNLSLDASKVFAGKHRVTIGTETQFNLRESQANYDVSPYFSYLNDSRGSIVPALYLQDEYSLRKNLIFSAGVRWDHYGEFGGTLNPRFGVIYSPRVRTTIKLLYGTAFRAPNDYELYYTAPPNEVPNTSLRPETIRTTELVLEQYVAKHLRFAVAGFYNDIRDLISEQSDPVNDLLHYANQQNVHGEGIDFEIAGKWRSGLQTRASWSIQESRDRQSGDILSDSPKSLAKFNLIAPLIPHRLTGALEGRYRGTVRTNGGVNLGGFVVGNATLSSQESMAGWSISAGVYNLFARNYATPAGPELPEDFIAQNGRTVRVKVTHRFGGK